MTDPHTTDTPPGVRLITDGGTNEPSAVKTATVKADGVTTAEIDGEERDVLRVPISSTRPDRENDRFSKEALEGMADQIRTDQPHVFDNHGLAGSWMDAIPYDSRETIGTQFEAEVVEADDGETDLYALVNPDGTHAEGGRMLKQVRDEKQAIKFSVGFGVRGYDERAEVEDDYEGEGRVFTSTDLMETSRVGIPANPDASLGVATAKNAGGAPGYALHPFMRLMAGGMDPEAFAAKSGGYTPEGDPDDLRAEVADLRAAVEELREDDDDEDDDDDDDDDDEEDDGKGPCDDNGDCPEGEVCVDGECVPEDEVDDSAGADPSEVEALRAEIADLRESIKELGAGRSKDPSTEPEDPDLTDDGEPDATDDAEPDEGEERDTAPDHEPLYG